MKLELISTEEYTKEGMTRTVERYNCGVYEIKRTTNDYGIGGLFSTYSIKCKNGYPKILSSKYIPDITVREDEDGNLIEFVIGTTTYGSLPIEEMRNMILCLEHAVEVVETLNNYFLKEEEK